MYRTTIACGLLTGLLVLAGSVPAFGQYTGDYQRPSASVRRNILRSPSVSPYLSLLDRQNEFGLPSYFTQVRPRLEQQERLREQGQAIGQLQQQFNAISAARAAEGQTAPGLIRATGHPTLYFNYSHYYNFGRRR